VEVSNDYSENIKSSGGHPTAKPVALWKLLLERFGMRGEVVYEPFLGSGTTAIAAEQLGMASYGIEIEPRYVAVSLERLRLATGAQPVLMRNNSSEPLGV
jgi:DNA modification methylase